MNGANGRGPEEKYGNEFAEQMEIARKVMVDNWVALRALALKDQFPDADVETLVKLAREQSADCTKSSKPTDCSSSAGEVGEDELAQWFRERAQKS